MHRGVSLLGLFVMIGLAWLMSSRRRKVSLRVVGLGLSLQLGLALLVLRTQFGHDAFELLGQAFRQLLDYVNAGSTFVFGEQYAEFYFAFKVLPTIIFFSSLMSVLYHIGLMQRIVWVCAWVMQKTLGTSGAESLSAAANIFVGQTEAPLVVKPFLSTMTLSELNAVMVGGFATVAGGVLALFIGVGIDASHLLTASVISAPAALLIAKVLEPEVGDPETKGRADFKVGTSSSNVFEAAASGATDGLWLALNVAAMLIAFIALVAMVDGILGWAGLQVGYEWSLQAIFGVIFWPLAWVMGIDAADCYVAADLLGKKMVLNEVVAYLALGELMHADSAVQLQPRSVVILTYALCGFSNFSSIGIQIGGLSAIAPNRKSDLARLGLRAMLGGTLACCMTACIAGLLI